MRQIIKVLFSCFLTLSLLLSGVTPAFSSEEGFSSVELREVQGSPKILEGATLLESLPKDEVLKLEVYLQPINQNQLKQSAENIKRLKEARTSNRTRHLDPEKVKEHYGRKDWEFQALTRYLKSYGIKIKRVYSTGLGLSLEGQVSQIEKAFSTQIMTYYKNGSDFYANSSSVKLPENLQPLIRYITGLDNYSRKKSLEVITQPNEVFAPVDYPLGSKLIQAVGTSRPITFQLKDEFGNLLLEAGKEIQLSAYLHGSKILSPNAQLSLEAATPAELMQTEVIQTGTFKALTDEKGQVHFNLTNTVNERIDLYTNFNPAPALTLVFYEKLPAPQTMNTSFIEEQAISTGQRLLTNLTSVPYGSTLEDIQDSRGLYSFQGPISVETRPRSEVPNLDGEAQIFIKLSQPVNSDEFIVLYKKGLDINTRYYGATFNGTWVGNPVIEEGLTPEHINIAYNAKSLLRKEATNPGAKIGIIASAEWIQSDIDTFFQTFNLPSPNLILRYVGTSGPLIKSGELLRELELDIERAGSAAPGAELYIYSEPWERPLIDALAAAINGNEVDVISSSIGMYESEMLPEEIRVWEDLMAIADAQGISVIFASGDFGAYENWYNPLSLEPSFPSLENITVVGGTQLGVDTNTLGWSSEEAWSPTGGAGFMARAGGGGFSTILPRPPWQPQGEIQGDFTHRGVPDISLHSSRDPGYATFIQGKWEIVGGTSAAAPTWAGYVGAMVHQSGKRFGNMNPLLYELASSSSGERLFHPIITGNNGFYVIEDSTIWDPVCGLGSVNVDEIAAALGVPDLQGESQVRAKPLIELGLGPRGNGSVGLIIGLGEFSDPQGNPISIRELTHFQAEITFNPEEVEISSPYLLNEAGIFSSTLEIRETEGHLILKFDATTKMETLTADNTPDLRKLFFVPVNLTHPIGAQTLINLQYTNILDQESRSIIASEESSYIFRRGKILNSNSETCIGIQDAAAGLQYLAKTRKAGLNAGEVNVVNMASILLPEEGAGTGTIGIKDILALLQYLAGLRDEYLNLK